MNRSTQESRLTDFFWSRFGEWIALHEILPFAAQYCARINAIRKKVRPRGYDIFNRTEMRPDGTKHSWYRLDYREAINTTKSTRHERALQFERESGKPQHPWKTAWSEKRLAQDDFFVLTPPEVRK